jgi:hypothetical protein
MIFTCISQLNHWVHVKNFEACTGSRKGLQFENKQKNLASAAEPAQTEGGAVYFFL